MACAMRDACETLLDVSRVAPCVTSALPCALLTLLTLCAVPSQEAALGVVVERTNRKASTRTYTDTTVCLNPNVHIIRTRTSE